MSILSQPQFHDEAAAFAYVEGILWPEGPTCPHCGACDRISAIKPNPAKKVRIGLKFCGHCRRQFTVRVGTVFEDSHLPMTKWLQAIFLMVSSKKGVSSHQLHRTLEITYKSAWFLTHRIREAMRSGDLAPFGGGGGAVEVDETASTPTMLSSRAIRSACPTRTRLSALWTAPRSCVVDRVSVTEVGQILGLSREAHLRTDQAGVYRTLTWNFAAHGVR